MWDGRSKIFTEHKLQEKIREVQGGRSFEEDHWIIKENTNGLFVNMMRAKSNIRK